MKSALRGKTISAVETGNVSRDGFWLRVDERDRIWPGRQHRPRNSSRRYLGKR
jgi:hypothetical protein